MTNNAAKSKVLTLVFTDLADSTALKTARGDAVVDALITRHREHVTHLAAECAGRIIDWAGDGCFLTFETSSAGVIFALRLQQSHANESDLPGVRIGIHMGEVTESTAADGRTDVRGLAVDLAARISGLAKPGQVLMSAAVYDSARQRIGVEAFGKPILWQAHGTYTLKGFDKAVEIGEAGLEGFALFEAPIAGDKAKLLRRAKRQRRHSPAAVTRARSGTPLWVGGLIIVLVIAIGVLLWREFQPGGGEAQTETGAPVSDEAGPITSIAVLPLDNLSNDPEQDYFADGMTEAITSELAKIRALKVISRTSVTQYKDTTKTIPAIAAELGVEGLVEGSVLRDGNDVRITVQLIDGASDTHLWSESYTNTITSVLKLQSDVALAIAQAIGAELTPDEQARIARDKPVDSEAYDLYLKAWDLINLTTEESLNRALAHLKRAQQIDPEMAEAWAAEARLHWVFAIQENQPMSEQIEKVRVAASRALALDDTQFYAHIAMGSYAQIHDFDWDTARRHFERAVELSPNEPLARFYLANNRNFFGDWSEAIKEGEQLIRLSPAASYERSLAAVVFTGANQSDRALDVLRGIDPLRTPRLPWLFANAYVAAGDAVRAIDSAKASEEWGVEAEALAMAGRNDDAMEILERLEALDESEARRLARDMDVAAAYIWLNDQDKAFSVLQVGRERLSQWVASLLREVYLDGRFQDPRWIAFRRDPRFWDLVQRVNLPPLPPEHPGYEEDRAWRARQVAAEEANAPIKAIAVLPFDNLMNDPEQEYFVDGMTEALITELAQIGSLQVRGRTSVLRYKDTTKSIPEIARELNVDGIIEGSVLRDGDQVRITAQLVHGSSDTHRWAGTFDSELTSILQLHSEMALAIANEVRANLTPEEEARIADAELVNREAYDLYLQGWSFGGQFSPQGLQQRLNYFVRATEVDPDFAPAWVGRAVVHNVIAGFGFGPSGGHYEALKSAAERALELDDTLPRAYSVLGFHDVARRWDWEAARANFDKAVELDPDAPNTHFIRAYYRLHSGDWAGADADALLALDLDPHATLPRSMAGFVLSNTHDRERGFDILEDLIADEPQNQLAHYWLSSAYARSGRVDRAVRIAALLAESLPGNPQVQVNLAYCLSHGDAAQREQARGIVDGLSSVPVETIPAPLLALYYATVGDLDDSFDWFVRATADPNMLLLTCLRLSPLDPGEYPNLDRFYRDPRYWALVERIGFPALPADNPLYRYQRERLARKAVVEAGNTPIEKIAVLPFENLMGDPEQEYFVDGMTETLVAQLAKIGGIRVVSRTSAMRYKNSDAPIPVIAGELGVDALVEGSVLRAGNDVRITAQLIHGLSDEHLWADTYDGTLDNILSLQSDVALDIAEQIQVAIAPADVERLREQRDVAPAVQEAYLKGLHHMNRRTEEDLERAVDYFNQAIDLDDHFAPAYASLAQTYILQSAWDFVAPLENVPRAEAAARRALELDPQSALGTLILGSTYMFKQEPNRAEALVRQAIELDPESPSAHHVNSVLHMFMGRIDEGLRENSLAHELDPVSLMINANLGMNYVLARDYESAIEQLKQTLDMDPNFRPALMNLPGTLALAGRFEEGVVAAERLLAEHGRTPPTLARHATVLAMAGRSEEARAAIEEANAMPTNYRPAFEVAMAYAQLGEFDEAIMYATQVLEGQHFEALALRVNPYLDPLRGDPRFEALIESMNLPPLPPDHPVSRMERERVRETAEN